MYSYETSIKLHQTDSAGIVFFGNYFHLAHDAYESFMESIGFGFDRIIHRSDFLVLIAHAEADYMKPVRASEKITVALKAKLGNSSFTLSYLIRNSDGEEVATLQTVHVALDKEKSEKIPLPKELRVKLETIA